MNGETDLLNRPLLRLSETDDWTYRDSFEGVAVFGDTGSGKTTGSGALLAKSYLTAGYAGLVLCAKRTERARWEAYAHDTGREDDLVIVSPQPDPRAGIVRQYNYLDWEMRREGAGAGQVENIVELLAITQAIVEGRYDVTQAEPFWNRASNALVRNVAYILTLSGRTLSVKSLTQLILSAPRGDQADDPVFQRRSELWDAILEAEARPKTPLERLNFESAKTYLLQHYASLADRTRSSVEATFTTIADVLLHDYLRLLFCGETNITPEAAYRDGAILLLDLNIREFGRVGIVAQRLFKTLFQRAVLRRDVGEWPRPVFLWADESHNFVDSFDYEFQAEARESRAATVYITQNISNYYAAHGANYRDEINALLGHFQTKIFHNNADPATNQWAAEVIGKELRTSKNWSAASNEFGGSLSISHTTKQDHKVDPAVFTALAKGGPASRWQADAILFQGGRRFRATGDTWLKVSFFQSEAFQPDPAFAPPNDANGLQNVQEPSSPGDMIWRGIELLEWMLVLRHQGDRVGEMIGMERLQLFVQQEPQQKPANLPVTPVQWQMQLPSPDVAALPDGLTPAQNALEDDPWHVTLIDRTDTPLSQNAKDDMT